jgi:hypothetical protein
MFNTSLTPCVNDLPSHTPKNSTFVSYVWFPLGVKDSDEHNEEEQMDPSGGGGGVKQVHYIYTVCCVRVFNRLSVTAKLQLYVE